jgi:DNA repair exonuclease SbcCD ATPase subunit
MTRRSEELNKRWKKEYKWIQEREKMLKIDPLALDKALIEQPQVFWEVSERLSNTISEADAIKSELKELDGSLYLEIRSEYERSGEKFSEAKINSEVLSDSQRLEVSTIHNDLCGIVNLLSALKESFNQRSYMLRELTRLHVTDYHAASSVQGPSADKYEEFVAREQLAKVRKPLSTKLNKQKS